MKMLGITMVATPFVGFWSFVTYQGGWAVAVGAFSATAVLAGLIIGGIYLITKDI